MQWAPYEEIRFGDICFEQDYLLVKAYGHSVVLLSVSQSGRVGILLSAAGLQLQTLDRS
jgi:hypothetical protein